jgi:8-oxo-dGTP pyrophosphatase MutT (NUDIX family)
VSQDEGAGRGELPPPRAAATVVVLRDGAEGIEALMLHRASAGDFGGMWVFPGGKVDPGDRDPARPDDELAAARRAAAREAEEEAGLVLEPDDLVPLSHWTPPPIAPRRFTTWFFLASAADAEVAVDGHEIEEHEWLRPDEVLVRRDGGAMELAPPTWVTLHTVAGHGTVDDLLAWARAGEPEHFATAMHAVEGGRVATWHGDVAHAGGELDGEGGRHRLLMLDGGWTYERTG